MIRLFLIFILSINIYADDNKTINDKFKVLEEKIYKIEQNSNLLKDENIRLNEKIKDIESTDKLYLIKKFSEELNSGSWFTNSISFSALLLSLFALYLNIKKEKANLKITPVSINVIDDLGYNSTNNYDKNAGAAYFGIEITNFSSFSVSINNVAFISLDNNKYIPKNRFVDRYKSKINFPLKMESRNSITIYFEINDIRYINPKGVRLALETGENFKGTSKAFKELIETF
ncbi:MAG: hypothetical protein U9R39_07180 [Campylobacterota bacterium]|nr:hypothetical protein [Campylobacterota bacterium]